MLKVLHLIHSFNRGGIEKWLISMLRQIPRSQCEMDFCSKGAEIGDLAPIVQELGAKVYHCPLTPGHFDFIQCLKRILIEGQYQILHNHLGIYSGIPTWLAHQYSIPVITSFHNTHFLPETSFTRFPVIRLLRSIYGIISIDYALRHSDLVTGCSQGVIQTFDPQETKMKKSSRVLYYGVNILDIATPEELAAFRNSFGWSADTPIILHVGRLIEQKNHLGILSIFQLILKQIPNAKLILIGEGILHSLIENAIASRKLDKSVIMLGLRDDVLSIMSKCDVFLFPSIYEGFGLVAIESLAANLPVVGSNIPGLTEAVLNGETALLHDVGDIDGMANSVIKIISDRQYAQQLAKAGRAWVKENFSLEVSANNLVNIYRSVIKT